MDDRSVDRARECDLCKLLPMIAMGGLTLIALMILAFGILLSVSGRQNCCPPAMAAPPAVAGPSLPATPVMPMPEGPPLATWITPVLLGMGFLVGAALVLILVLVVLMFLWRPGGLPLGQLLGVLGALAGVFLRLPEIVRHLREAAAALHRAKVATGLVASAVGGASAAVGTASDKLDSVSIPSLQWSLEPVPHTPWYYVVFHSDWSTKPFSPVKTELDQVETDLSGARDKLNDLGGDMEASSKAITAVADALAQLIP